MTTLRSRLARVLCSALLPALLLAGCDPRSAVDLPPAPTETPRVTLRVFHWIGSDSGGAIKEINRRFEAENPGIYVQFESLQPDQYRLVLERRIAVGDAPDVIGLSPLLPQDSYLKPEDLLDLSGEPWVARLNAEGLTAATSGSKIIAYPLGQATIGVIYNKDLFRSLGVSVPRSGDELLATCAKINAAGVVPIALPDADFWTKQLVPRAMAVSSIYASQPEYDQALLAGRTSFSASHWRSVLSAFLNLNTQGCFNDDALETSYDQSIELLATGRAAMVVNGTWVVSQIRAGNPKMQIGVFSLPYPAAGGDSVRAVGVTEMMGILAASSHPAAARRYLEFWSRPVNAERLLESRSELPLLTDVSADLDPAVAEYVAQTPRAVDAFNPAWPFAARVGLYDNLGHLLWGDMTIDAFWAGMDEAFTAK